MKITNYKIYDLQESLVASGYPMQTDVKEWGYLSPTDKTKYYFSPYGYYVLDGVPEEEEKDVKRASKLSKLSETDNQAHGQFLSGIIVSFDLTCTNKMWVEMERYRFVTFVSSQSTMHRIAKFDLDNSYCKFVDKNIVYIIKEKVKKYNEHLEDENYDKEKLKEEYLEILYSNPCGFELTARLTTNYRCLKNIYYQRKDHRLPEWREFCKWIETLPYFKELIGVREEKDNTHA